MKTTKKLVAAIAAFVMALAFASCGSNEDKVAGNTYVYDNGYHHVHLHFYADGTGDCYDIVEGTYEWWDEDGKTQKADALPSQLPPWKWVQDKKGKEITITGGSAWDFKGTYSYADASVKIKFTLADADFVKQ